MDAAFCHACKMMLTPNKLKYYQSFRLYIVYPAPGVEELPVCGLMSTSTLMNICDTANRKMRSLKWKIVA